MTQDVVWVGAFVTSIASYAPDFLNSTKAVENKTRSDGTYVHGDELEYTIVVRNTGDDAAVGVVFTDELVPTLDYKLGSITIDNVVQSDTSGNGQAEYVPATRTIVARLGTGASSSKGGKLAQGASVTIKFRAYINASAGTSISNQGAVSAAGELGTPVNNWPTGTLEAVGEETVVGPLGECSVTTDCEGAALCDAITNTCVECLSDANCPLGLSCDAVTNECVFGPPSIDSPANGSTIVDRRPAVFGYSLPGASVSVEIDGVSHGTVTAGPDGRWELPLTSDLACGTHEIKARAVVAGVTSPEAQSNFTVVPLPPVIDSPVDGSTIAKPRTPVSGTGEPGTVVTVTLAGGSTVCTATVGSDGAGVASPRPICPSVK